MQQTVISILLWLLLVSVVDATTSRPLSFSSSTLNSDDPLSSTAEPSHSLTWILVVVFVAVLFVIILIGVICCIWRRRKAKRSKDSALPKKGTTKKAKHKSLEAEKEADKSGGSVKLAEEGTQKSAGYNSVISQTERPSEGKVTAKESEDKAAGSKMKVKTNKTNRKPEPSENTKRGRTKTCVVEGTEYWNENSAKMFEDIKKKTKTVTIEINEAAFGYSRDQQPSKGVVVNVLNFPHTEDSRAAEKEAQVKEAGLARAVFDRTQATVSPPQSKAKSVVQKTIVQTTQDDSAKSRGE